ncbi:MAG: calcium-binding protein, partial [Dongiaceae bacterium]
MAKIKGKKGDDILNGTSQSDSIFGGAGNDQLYGHQGNDFLSGGLGNDLLEGGEGNDALSGGGGNDVIDGGLGDDDLAGDAGADVFLHRAGDGFDTIAAGGYDSLDAVQLVGTDFYDVNYDRSGTDLRLAGAIDENYDFGDTGSLTFENFFSGGSGFLTVQIDTVDNLFYSADPEIATFRFEQGRV